MLSTLREKANRLIERYGSEVGAVAKIAANALIPGAPMIVRMSAHSAPTHTPSLTNTANQYVPSLRPIIFMLSISFASFSARSSDSSSLISESELQLMALYPRIFSREKVDLTMQRFS